MGVKFIIKAIRAAKNPRRNILIWEGLLKVFFSSPSLQVKWNGGCTWQMKKLHCLPQLAIETKFVNKLWGLRYQVVHTNNLYKYIHGLKRRGRRRWRRRTTILELVLGGKGASSLPRNQKTSKTLWGLHVLLCPGLVISFVLVPLLLLLVRLGKWDDAYLIYNINSLLFLLYLPLNHSGAQRGWYVTRCASSSTSTLPTWDYYAE